MNVNSFNGSYILISAGQSGSVVNNILKRKLEDQNIPVETYIFNTSEFDTHGLENENFYLVGPGGGTGKNPALGKKLAQENKESIDSIIENIHDKNAEGEERKAIAVFFTYGSSGGSGGGLSSVIVSKIKSVFGKEVPVIVNSIKCFEFETIGNMNFVNNIIEMSGFLQRKEIVFNLVDNQKFSDKHNTTDFKEINEYITNYLLLFNYDYIVKHSTLTDTFSLDRKDFYRLVNQKGNSGGVASIYGYKDGEINNFFNYGGVDVEFAGARKVLCIVKDSKYIKDVKLALNKLGHTEIMEFKSMNFSDKLIGHKDLQALIYSVGEYKSDNIVDEVMEKYQESQLINEEIKKKDSIKDDIKSKVKKIKMKV